MVFLDEPALVQTLLDMGVQDDEIVDFESVSNSAFLVRDNTLFTYFSNTVLMDGDAVHDLSRRGVSAHIVMFLLLTPPRRGGRRALDAGVASLGRAARDWRGGARAQDGTHGVIDIAKT